MKVDHFGLSEDDIAEIVDFFEVYSLSQLPAGTEREDLPIPTKSLEVVLSDMGFLVTEAELINLQKKLDPEKKGYICLPQFVSDAAGPLFARTRLTEENADAVFQMFDSDEDGLIRTSDLKDVLALFGERLPDDYVQEMLNEVDMDGDKAIGLDEFKYFAAGEVF